MRPLSQKAIVAFHEEFPSATTGLFLSDKQLLITGHENGMVVQWSTSKTKPEILHRCYSKIETMSVSPKESEIAVGCNSGLLFTFDLKSPKKRHVIQEASDSVLARVWRSVWPFDDVLVTSSTYGEIRVWKRDHEARWTFQNLPGHQHSIFGLASSADKFLASGDFQGRVFVWEYDDVSYKEVDSLRTPSSIQNASWGTSESFATIGKSGRIQLFEQDQTKKWNSVFEVDAATSGGNIIHIARNGNSIFGGTETELIQFDVETQQVQQVPFKHARAIFSNEEFIFVLADSRFVSFERSPVEVPLRLVTYRYAKISLIGHTGVGKTTFSDSIIRRSISGIKSTIGKRVATWVPDPSIKPERRIVFHDHGGQETVLGTFLPFLADSDIILVFFQQTDRVTFEKAAKILEEIPPVVDRRTKIMLVRTFIDQINEVSDREVKELLQKTGVADVYAVSPLTGDGMARIVDGILSQINWGKAKTMIQSESVQGVQHVISELRDVQRPIVALGEVKSLYEKSMGKTISKGHLSFLLSNFADQGMIEYYPAILDSIILDDVDYNKLRSEIPFYVSENHGIVSVEALLEKFKPRIYAEILDQVYTSTGVAVRNRDLRIFPERLRETNLNIPEEYSSLLRKAVHSGELKLSSQQINLGALVQALSEQNLGCIDIVKSEGLFGWEMNALVHYTIRTTLDALTGNYIEIRFRVGGRQKVICDRLNRVFSEIVNQLFGPTVKDGGNGK